MLGCHSILKDLFHLVIVLFVCYLCIVCLLL